MKRGEDLFKNFKKFAIQISRSSDGKWERKGKQLPFIDFEFPHQGKEKHSNKKICTLVIWEYCVCLAWYIKEN